MGKIGNGEQVHSPHILVVAANGYKKQEVFFWKLDSLD